ncbi:MAG: hypothetical protein BIFFINMI_02176 [Phycisphaerae bacterium]|nr:hypothetical protein [Phycisphaerae bacterium]
MRNRLSLLAIAIVSLLAGGLSASAGTDFAVKPAAGRDGDKVVITFTVSSATDVEVAVLDAAGKVVRHLAAGMLGGQTAPPPPLQAGLAQKIEWDGLDDYGQKPAGGPFQARVRACVRAAFERSVSIKVFNEKSVTYGPGGLDSSGDLIEMTSPVFMNGSKMHSPDPSRLKFYAGTTRIDMVVSDESDEILLQCWSSGPLGAWKDVPIARFDGLTGKLLGILPKEGWDKVGPFGKGEPVMDWFGKYFLHDGYGWDVARFTLDGKPLDFPGGANKFTLPERFRRHVHQRGMAVGPDGNIYVAEIPLKAEKDPTLVQSNFVSRFDANGKLLRDGLVQVYAAIDQGVNLDLKGNIFVGVGLKLAGKPVPDEIAAKVDGKPDDPFSRACWARALYGSIVKFGPAGGRIVPDPKGDLESRGGNNGKVTRLTGQGVKWVHYGASFQPTHNGEDNLKCFCFTPRFDVDRFGRVLFPDPFANEFKCLDNEGNLVFRVHNRDFKDKAKVGCGTTVQATDRGIYVADHPNNQILIFRWKADVEQLMAIP